MSDVLSGLSRQFDSNAIGALAEQIGADHAQTQSAVQAALPMLIAALAKNSGQPGGAAALRGALDQHDGGILDDILSAFGQRATAATGGAILGHVLGSRQAPMEQALSGMSGLSSQSAGKLLALLAPIIMGYLGRQARQQGFDAGSLASMLGQADTHARAQQPAGGSLLTSLLDKDGDGSIVDDLGQMGMGILGGFLNKH